MAKLVVDILDPTKFIKVNDVKPVTSPIFFNRNNEPTPDGLLSNEIFGITSKERRETFGYINLEEYFIHPLYYKIMCKVDKRFKECVHGVKDFIITSDGSLQEAENGEHGIKFLKNNLDKIKFKKSESIKVGEYIQFLNAHKKEAFMKELIVIPPLYRDVKSSGGKTGIGEINTLYMNIIISVRSIKESGELGFSLSDATRGRIQELILSVYDWFGSGTIIQGIETPAVLPGKLGVIRRAGTGKTADASARNVITAPNYKEDYMKDFIVDPTHAAMPLATVCVNFRQYMIFHVRRFFENEFGGDYSSSLIDEKGNIVHVKVKDPQIAFSDTRINEEINRFIKGYSNRLIAIEVPVEDMPKNKKVYMKFIGRKCSEEDYLKHKKEGTLLDVPILDRPMTWCDLFFICAQEFIDDKVVLLTRFPIDSFYNQFPQKIRISTTNKTEPMIIRDKFIKHYPMIREEDIGSNTSTMFIDSVQFSNAHLESIGGDYDGDTVSDKGVYSVEANEELISYMNSKAFYISLAGTTIRGTAKEGKQAIYSLTKVLPGTKLTPVVE